VRWALEHKRLTYKSHTINLLKGEHKEPAYLHINPAGVLPTLVVDGVPYSESLALLEWIEESYPQRPLLPQTPNERAFVRRLAQTIAVGIFPIQNLSVQKYVGDRGIDRLAFAKHWIEQGFATYETLLVQNSCAGTYSFGAHVTMADLCLVPQVYNALRFGVDMKKFPEISGIYNRCLKVQECDKAAPHNQPDAVK
jgi:maleylacetoacetate isomerase